MRRYFLNPELKISSGILLCLMFIFFIGTTLTLNVYHNNLKEDYIRSFGAVVFRISEKNPELEKDIIPIITKEVSEKEAQEGEKLLSKYGLTKELENDLFPYVNKIAAKNAKNMAFVFAVMTGILGVLNYFQFGYFYNKIRKLTLGAKKVVEGDYNITLNESKEGDLSKLAVSFNSMKEIIRNNISELNKEKQFLVDLLSDISHQLKTPLSSMIIYNDIMLNKELSKEQIKTFLINNQSQLSRMQHLIQSILKLAKIDAKAIELDKEKQSLNETVQEAIEALESKSFEHKVNIIFDEKEEIIFEHDRLWLQEALINIIKNGIEHTHSGGEINISLFENPVYKRIIIKDNGEGISEEDLPNIFKRFYKAKTSKKSDSIGIGLALSKSIIEAHYGIIEVKSKVGFGTKFIITFLKY